MGTFTTALGDEYTLERRLPRVGWKPRWRGGDASDASFLDLGGGDADGILAFIALIVVAIAVVVVVLPLLLFVAELALVVALVIPLTIVAIAVGAVQHEVVLRRGSGPDATVIVRREARGVISSYRTKRELRAAAESGQFRGLTGPAVAALPAEGAAASSPAGGGAAPPSGLG